MLINLFQTIRSAGVPCTLRELLDLLGALENQLVYADLDDFSRTKIFNLLPGPYTVLLKSKNNPNISKLVQAGSHLIGIRVINLDFCNEVIQRLGNPIITTSVNRHKMPSLSSIKEIKKEFPDIDIFYTQDSIKSSGSTIIDFSLKKEKVIRLGEGDF